MSAGASMRGDLVGGEQEFGIRCGADLASEANPQAYLLHALNQPLTGLQCSLELATVGSRTPEQYLSAIGEGLELVGRMRLLVEALREVADIASDGWAQVGLEQNSSRAGRFLPAGAIALDTLVRGTVDDLRPVAESRGLHIDVDGNSFPRPSLARRDISAVIFRVLDSVLSLAAERSVLSVHLKTQAEQAVAIIEYLERGGPASLSSSSFSAPGLGLLVARTAWLQAGGQWQSELVQSKRTLALSLPWADSSQRRPVVAEGNRS